jgi:hypothetical protein
MYILGGSGATRSIYGLAGQPGLGSRQRQKASTLALEHTQLFRWLSRGMGVKLTTHLCLVSRSRSYISTPDMGLHDMLLIS